MEQYAALGLGETKSKNPFANGEQNSELELCFKCVDQAALRTGSNATDIQNIFKTLAQPLDLRYRLDAKGDVHVASYSEQE